MTKHILIVYLSITFVFLITTVNAFAFKLPDTGQTKCYQSVSPYAEIPCPGTGQDGAYNANPKSYMVIGSNNDMVLDNNTGLIWQRQDDGYTYNWYQATGTNDVTYNPTSQNICGPLLIGGYSDWRLPSRKELITIVDYSIPAPGPTINPVFANAGSSYYWSSNLDAHSPTGGGAWGVRFSDGYISNSEWVGEAYRVRCVRGAQELPTFTDNGNGTVTDERTGTVWQKEDDDMLRTWGEALSYCEGLNLASQSDWRLPNIIELESIVDDTREQPAIDPVFTKTKAYPYCSSTSYTASPNYAWFVIFGAGEAAYNDDGITKGYSYYVRCARDGQSGSLGKLSISKNGIGSGTVISSPVGINCGGFCSTYYPINSSVVLTATPSTGGSIFAWWSNDLDCLDGVVTLNADKTCVATFGLCDSMSVAMTDSAGPFDSIKAAYGGASSSDTIRIIASNQQEGDLVFADKDLTLQGGYDCAFTEPPTTFTTITGSLAISSGSLNISGIRIQ